MTDEPVTFAIRQPKPFWFPYLGFTEVRGLKGYKSAFVFMWFRFIWIFRFKKGENVEQ